LAFPPQADEKKHVEAVIYAFFEAGKNKDLASLAGFHSKESFTKFDENPPFTRQNADEAFIHEQAAFANISDYTYRVDELKVDLFEDVAVATFYLTYRGIFVNDYSFEGSPVGSKDRVTMVLCRVRQDWKIVHEHFSRFPGWDHGKSDALPQESGRIG